MDINKITGVVAKELHVYYVLDTSGSMDGAPIAALNDAMRTTVNELNKVAKTSNEADFKIGVIEYNSKFSWVTVNSQNEPIVQNIEDFMWNDLSASGLTYLGATLTELNKQLSRNYLQKSPVGNKRPIIIFMSDGFPNDDWQKPLEQLKENKWFQQAIKIAFALGDAADTKVLADIVGPEGVIKTNDLDVFKNMIVICSVTSSLASSTSVVTQNDMTGGDIVKKIIGENAEKDGNGAMIVEKNTQTYTDDSIYGDDEQLNFADANFIV